MQRNMKSKQGLSIALLSGVMVGSALIGGTAGVMPFGLTAAHAEGHGGKPGRKPLTAAQNQAIYAAVLVRDNAVLAADQAYVAAETTVFAGTTANTGNQDLTAAQQQALKTAERTRDTAIRAAQRQYNQTIAQILSNTTTTGQTGVTVSRAEASVEDSTIELRFTGPLDATTAGVATNYTVQVNGIALAVASATFHDAHVTLGLADGALKAGDKVTVTYSGLKDVKGNAVAGNVSVTAK